MSKRALQIGVNEGPPETAWLISSAPSESTLTTANTRVALVQHPDNPDYHRLWENNLGAQEFGVRVTIEATTAVLLEAAISAIRTRLMEARLHDIKWLADGTERFSVPDWFRHQTECSIEREDHDRGCYLDVYFSVEGQRSGSGRPPGAPGTSAGIGWQIDFAASGGIHAWHEFEAADVAAVNARLADLRQDNNRPPHLTGDSYKLHEGVAFAPGPEGGIWRVRADLRSQPDTPAMPAAVVDFDYQISRQPRPANVSETRLEAPATNVQIDITLFVRTFEGGVTGGGSVTSLALTPDVANQAADAVMGALGPSLTFTEHQRTFRHGRRLGEIRVTITGIGDSASDGEIERSESKSYNLAANNERSDRADGKRRVYKPPGGAGVRVIHKLSILSYERPVYTMPPLPSGDWTLDDIRGEHPLPERHGGGPLLYRLEAEAVYTRDVGDNSQSVEMPEYEAGAEVDFERLIGGG